MIDPAVAGSPASANALPAPLLEALALHGMTRVHAKGTLVVAEGEPALSMYLVHEGQLRVFVSDEDGREVQLNTLGPGEYFGELMLGSQVRTATVQTLTRARLTMITRPEFERALAERPDLAFHVIQHLIERVRVLSRNVQGLVSMDVYGRVVRLFNELAVDLDGQRAVPGPLSQQKIADRVGASRSMVNRILQELAGGGYIEVGRDRILLKRALPKRW
ncbi:Crp/Fnr family transcriptional regulator [Ideonella sp. A 288]|uniref:Crp/Fnr family transcriptional regulator n=1 Tax=Ideonella sp. A 288 TaxID=1962181 RepID=UPI0013037FD6|nr:Crp/Fnr family transcriptional regulator [Ideonella sp. A 288]